MKKAYIIILVIIVIVIINFPTRFKNAIEKSIVTNYDDILIKQIKQSNQTELTYQKLKTYKGFENITEEESVKQIEGIKKLAKILFHLYETEKRN